MVNPVIANEVKQSPADQLGIAAARTPPQGLVAGVTAVAVLRRKKTRLAMTFLTFCGGTRRGMLAMANAAKVV